MILNLQRLITLKAMMAQLSTVELEDACILALATIEQASRGEDISYWDFDSLCDAIDEWDSKGESLR